MNTPVHDKRACLCPFVQPHVPVGSQVSIKSSLRRKKNICSQGRPRVAKVKSAFAETSFLMTGRRQSFSHRRSSTLICAPPRIITCQRCQEEEADESEQTWEASILRAATTVHITTNEVSDFQDSQILAMHSQNLTDSALHTTTKPVSQNSGLHYYSTSSGTSLLFSS